MQYEKRLKVGKVERYSLGIADWLNGEAITSANVLVDSGMTAGAVDFVGATVGVLVTGVSVGKHEILFNYTTASRSDSDKHTIEVIAADSI